MHGVLSRHSDIGEPLSAARAEARHTGGQGLFGQAGTTRIIPLQGELVIAEGCSTMLVQIDDKPRYAFQPSCWRVATVLLFRRRSMLRLTPGCPTP